MTLEASGADVSEIAVRVRTNTVDIVVSRSSPAGTEARGAADLGPAVTVTRKASSGAGGTDSRISPYPHVRAGLEIWSSATSCTAGLHFVNSLGQYYMLTAGHCGNRSWREGTATGRPSVPPMPTTERTTPAATARP